MGHEYLFIFIVIVGVLSVGRGFSIKRNSCLRLISKSTSRGAQQLPIMMASQASESADKYSPNLDNYFARIGYTGSREPTLSNLKSIQRHHLIGIPFENLDIHLGYKISVDPKAVEQKIVDNRRGGYCFEQNLLLCHVLRALGFEITPLIARVIWQKPAQVTTGNTHMILRVECEGSSWLVDTGFGSMGSPQPLNIFSEGEQTTSSYVRRVLQVGNHYVHQVKLQGNWQNIYRFNLDESYPSDWEIGSHFSSTHPSAVFVKNIVVSRFTEECRYVLVNKEFSIRPLSRAAGNVSVEGDDVTEKREIKSESEYYDILNRYFLLDLLGDDTAAEGKNVPSLCPPGTTW